MLGSGMICGRSLLALGFVIRYVGLVFRLSEPPVLCGMSQLNNIFPVCFQIFSVNQTFSE